MGLLNQETEVRAWLAQVFPDLHPDNVFGIWCELEDARLGQNGFGGDTAEIYAYLLLPSGPRYPISDLSDQTQGRLAAENLERIARGFQTVHSQCKICVEVPAEARWDWRPVDHGVLPWTHRVHVRVEFRPETDPAITAPGVPDEETRFLLVRVDGDAVRTTRFRDKMDLLANVLGLVSPSVPAARRFELLSAFLAELDREAARALGSNSHRMNSHRIRYVFPVPGATQSVDMATVVKELDVAVSALEHSDDIEAASALMSVRLRLAEVRKQMLTTQNRMGYVAGLIYDALTFTDHPTMTRPMVLGLRQLIPTLTESPFSPSILMDIRRRLLQLGFNVVPAVNAQ
jgi:hypothetical protein